jgi:branched-chain amino acid transport system ATP-binding protein
MLLKLKGVTVYYESSLAIEDINMDVPEGTVTSIMGANGAGKSTILKAISGLVTLTGGEILFENKRIDKMAAHRIVHLGIVQVPEGRRLFPYMSVMENLRIGTYLRKDNDDIKKDLDDIFCRFPFLWERRAQRAGTLSGGQQQTLAICRALMAKPKILLMDEPSMGLAPRTVDELVSVIMTINESGISVLLAEQNAGLVMQVAQRGYVIEVGKIILEGDMCELKGNTIVKKAFLGG